ncbi:MAG: F0F1 ATP synthase subunit epsilon [Pseudomonadota bacterium]
MAMTTTCDIVSAEEAIFSGTVTMVVATGVMGELGILPGHTALLTQLRPGPIRLVKEDGEEDIFYCSGGILEVQPNVVTILADTVERAATLDLAAAEDARKAAELALANQKDEVDYANAAAQLAEAVARLRTLDAIRKKMGRPG